MRTLMFASLMSVVACGSVSDPGAMTGDSGSDSNEPGSGSDMTDAGMPASSGALTIDGSDFVVDMDTWWTSTSGPTLHGTFQGAPGAVVGIEIDDGAAMPATLSGTTWAIALPAGSITTSSSAVVIEMTDPSGGDIRISRTLGLDSAPPAITVQASTIRDERGDTIDFTTGEPIHTHAGPAIDLGATGCPSVYKYAYLMDASPTYGSATSPNDLAWKLRIQDAKLKAGSQQFRVRTDAGAVLLDWTALPAADAAGYSTVKLTRNGGTYPIGELGTRTGHFFIDVRATDWAELSTTQSFCFDHHPLAAPLAVSAFERGSLFDITTANDADVTAMMVSGSVQIVKQHIVQQTAEPVTMSWSASGSSPVFTANKVAGWVAEIVPSSIGCGSGSTNPWCVMATTPPPYAPASEATTNGTLQHASYRATVRDEVSGAIVASATGPSVTWTIPPRAVGAPPHVYSFDVSMVGYAELMPDHGWWYAETATNTLMGLGYTGDAALNVKYGCAEMGTSAFGPYCSSVITYWDYTAIDRATLSFSPFVATVTAGVDAQHLVAASYVRASTLTSEALTWDSGDNDLPGAF